MVTAVVLTENISILIEISWNFVWLLIMSASLNGKCATNCDFSLYSGEMTDVCC